MFPNIKVRETKEGLLEVTRIQTIFSFFFELVTDITIYGTLLYFAINHWLGNFTIVWK